MKKKYGLKFDIVKPEDYFLGGGFIGTEEIQPDGQWDAFLPAEELQNLNKIETQNCTAFGTENCLNILMNKVFHEDKNYSERFIGIMAGTDPYGGNSPHVVGESVRHNGVIEEKSLPFSEDITTPEEYYQPKPMNTSRLVEGQKWLRTYSFKHEWVYSNNPILEEKIRLIKEALKRSPVGASVYAWVCDENGIYYKAGVSNHWVCIYGWNEHGWKIFDSYDNTYKIYSFNSDIEMAKLYWLKKNPPRKDNWLSEIVKNVLLLVKDLIFKIKR